MHCIVHDRAITSARFKIGTSRSMKIAGASSIQGGVR